jgi:hypothetical protein
LKQKQRKQMIILKKVSYLGGINNFVIQKYTFRYN